MWQGGLILLDLCSSVPVKFFNVQTIHNIKVSVNVKSAVPKKFYLIGCLLITCYTQALFQGIEAKVHGYVWHWFRVSDCSFITVLIDMLSLSF